MIGLIPILRLRRQAMLAGILILSAIATAKWSGIFVKRTLEKWLQYRQTLSPQQIERWLLRANSFAPIIKGAIATIFITAAVLFVLSQLSIPLASIKANIQLTERPIYQPTQSTN